MVKVWSFSRNPHACARPKTREASVMNAMYEKKLALQAESYMQLKIAYEELSQVLPATVVSVSTRVFRCPA